MPSPARKGLLCSAPLLQLTSCCSPLFSVFRVLFPAPGTEGWPGFPQPCPSFGPSPGLPVGFFSQPAKAYFSTGRFPQPGASWGISLRPNQGQSCLCGFSRSVCPNSALLLGPCAPAPAPAGCPVLRGRPCRPILASTAQDSLSGAVKAGEGQEMGS